ncbi:hypothetical protein AURANDRAFT_67752 [Aureococcus anophagefferens]|uniref:Serine-threonine/tyrosine-protein kinase catalytic domain-containing protein n=1 Tax=Aureococcus anophagefferens TaxID=44056 RepID=F0YMA2_AURAN|nr:hypothetical protein AURANDRAFT_67752 [Aureococcus anophagefferens]EGB03753.1 hypothetical protein AURANDRAFT_67752 [Aureococcus anophagefferens]|eukprot:XP_009041538.1 hypothetical protein AURANDRAFT_67752 [Aureococcus anophagefferens]
MVRRLLLVGAAAAAARIVFPAPYAVNVGGDALVDVLVEGPDPAPAELWVDGVRACPAPGACDSDVCPVAGDVVCEVAEVADVRGLDDGAFVGVRTRFRLSGLDFGARGLQDGRAGEAVVLRVAPPRPALNIGQWHLDPGSFGDSADWRRLAAKADNLRYFTTLRLNGALGCASLAPALAQILVDAAFFDAESLGPDGDWVTAAVLGSLSCAAATRVVVFGDACPAGVLRWASVLPRVDGRGRSRVADGDAAGGCGGWTWGPRRPATLTVVAPRRALEDVIAEDGGPLARILGMPAARGGAAPARPSSATLLWPAGVDGPTVGLAVGSACCAAAARLFGPDEPLLLGLLPDFTFLGALSSYPESLHFQMDLERPASARAVRVVSDADARAFCHTLAGNDTLAFVGPVTAPVVLHALHVAAGYADPVHAGQTPRAPAAALSRVQKALTFRVPAALAFEALGAAGFEGLGGRSRDAAFAKVSDSDEAARECHFSALVRGGAAPAALGAVWRVGGELWAHGAAPTDAPSNSWSACFVEELDGTRQFHDYLDDEGARGALVGLKGLLEAALALARARVVHRDLGSWNVLVDSQDRVRVVDFGWAAALDDDGVASAASPFGDAIHRHTGLRLNFRPGLGPPLSDGAAVADLARLARAALDGAPGFEREAAAAGAAADALDAHGALHPGLVGFEAGLADALATLAAPPAPAKAPRTYAACAPPSARGAGDGFHVLVFWAVSRPAWAGLLLAAEATAKLVAVVQLAPAPTCQRIQRLYGHQPLASPILEGKCGFVDGKGEALVVVADFGSPSPLSADDAPGPAATQAAADGRAISLKRRLRARHLELDVPVPDFVHGTVDRCEAARDAFFFTGRRLADLAALAASDPPVVNGRVVVRRRAGVAGDDKTAGGWDSFRDLLFYLNATVAYVVYRNGAACVAGRCGDADLLVDDLHAAVVAVAAGVGEEPSSWPGAGATRFEWSEHHYGTVIAGRRGWVEIRQWDADEGFGDSAPKRWRGDILKRRVCDGDHCEPGPLDAFHTTLDRALVPRAARPDTPKLDARYVPVLRAAAPRLGAAAVALAADLRVGALAAYHAAFLAAHGYLEPGADAALAALANRTDAMPIFHKPGALAAPFDSSLHPELISVPPTFNLPGF